MAGVAVSPTGRRGLFAGLAALACLLLWPLMSIQEARADDCPTLACLTLPPVVTVPNPLGGPPISVGGQQVVPNTPCLLCGLPVVPQVICVRGVSCSAATPGQAQSAPAASNPTPAPAPAARAPVATIPQSAAVGGFTPVAAPAPATASPTTTSSQDLPGLKPTPPPSIEAISTVPPMHFGSAPFLWPLLAGLDALALVAVILVVRRTWSRKPAS